MTEVQQGNTQDSPRMAELMLNTDSYLLKFKYFLEGVQPFYEVDNEGTQRLIIKKVGVAKANAEGCEAILSFVENICNPQVVLGNWKETDFQEYVCYAQIDLCMLLAQNKAKWGIHNSNKMLIVANVMNTARVFLTRPIDDGERQSHKQVMRIQENTVMQERQPEKTGWFGGWRK